MYNNFMNQPPQNFNNNMFGGQQQHQPMFGGAKQEIIRVNGEEGAKAYQLGVNSNILLLDNTAPIIWLKATDGAGYPTLTAYEITPLAEKVKQEEITLNDRIQQLEKKVEDLLNAKQSNIEHAKSNKQNNSNNNSKHNASTSTSNATT